jgi:hypothetical protein
MPQTKCSPTQSVKIRNPKLENPKPWWVLRVNHQVIYLFSVSSAASAVNSICNFVLACFGSSRRLIATTFCYRVNALVFLRQFHSSSQFPVGLGDQVLGANHSLFPIAQKTFGVPKSRFTPTKFLTRDQNYSSASDQLHCSCLTISAL